MHYWHWDCWNEDAYRVNWMYNRLQNDLQEAQLFANRRGQNKNTVDASRKKVAQIMGKMPKLQSKNRVIK